MLVFNQPSESAESLPKVLLPFIVLAVVPGVLLGYVQTQAVLGMKVGRSDPNCHTDTGTRSAACFFPLEWT